MVNWRWCRSKFSYLVVTAIALCTLGTLTLAAQTYTVLYNFTGGRDGAFLDAPLILDNAGNLYGEAVSGGTHNGTVFKLGRRNGFWVFTPLYLFQGGQDGATPEGGLTFGPDGSLYGTTVFGGGLGGSVCLNQGCGTIFNLHPSPTPPHSTQTYWKEKVLYRFTGHSDGGEPECQPAFDHAGNLYCTAFTGGNGCSSGCGTVYELERSGTSWSFSLIHAFAHGNDGSLPQGGVTVDQTGRLFGVTELGGGGTGCGSDGCGITYTFSPSGTGWTESIAHAFSGGSGIYPNSGVVLDQSGNIYGSTAYLQNGGSMGGVVYELSPAGGGWTYTELYALPTNSGTTNSLAVDSLGNLYGTTSGDGSSNYGSVFKLAPSNGGWNYSVLHEFTGGADGQNPICRVVVDASGTVYGVTNMGGTYGYGLIFQITQ